MQVVRKKNKELNYIELLKEQVSNSQLIHEYPKREMEPWRRFSPDNILPQFYESIQNGIKKGIPGVEPSNGKPVALKTLGEWKKSDEIFFAKVKKSFEKIPKNSDADFFKKFTESEYGEENLWVLRISPDFNNTNMEVKWIFSNLDEKSLLLNHLFVYIENGCNTKIILNHSNSIFTITSYQFYQEMNSVLETHYTHFQGIIHGTSLSYHTSFQEKNTSSKHGLYSLQSPKAKFLYATELSQDAKTDIYGIHTGDRSLADHDFNVLHSGSHSDSNIFFKAAMLDHAYATFWGKTRIIAGTAGCNGYQSNKNILLGKKSRVDAIPRLEISTEDVAASHGSATGELSDEEIFYLMTRGLSELEAKNLLLRGFFEDIINKSIDHPEESWTETLINSIWEKIEAKLHI